MELNWDVLLIFPLWKNEHKARASRNHPGSSSSHQHRCNPEASYPAGQVLRVLQVKIWMTELRVKPCGHQRKTISCSTTWPDTEYAKIRSVPASGEIPAWSHDLDLIYSRNAWMDGNPGRSGQVSRSWTVFVVVNPRALTPSPGGRFQESSQLVENKLQVFRSTKHLKSHTRISLDTDMNGSAVKPFSRAPRRSAVGNQTWQLLGGLPSVSLSGQRSYRSRSKRFNHWRPGRSWPD